MCPCQSCIKNRKKIKQDCLHSILKVTKYAYPNLWSVTIAPMPRYLAEIASDLSGRCPMCTVQECDPICQLHPLMHWTLMTLHNNGWDLDKLHCKYDGDRVIPVNCLISSNVAIQTVHASKQIDSVIVRMRST